MRVASAKGRTAIGVNNFSFARFVKKRPNFEPGAEFQTATVQNTVFARLKINSEREQIKKVRFGFSDNVKVYFNRNLIYGGTDIYRSRDYRFLGTLGLWDELYLPLKAGNNELWFAVTENFGGWGVKALFDNQDGIKIE